jgi:hypothetical protein
VGVARCLERAGECELQLERAWDARMTLERALKSVRLATTEDPETPGAEALIEEIDEARRRARKMLTHPS